MKGLTLRIRRLLGVLVASTLGVTFLSFASTASAKSPGLEALDEFRSPSDERQAVENRFFLKEGRFEISPVFGYVPNNAFVRRIVGSALIGYHFNETWSVQGQLSYSPDLGESDLKGLTSILLQRNFEARSADPSGDLTEFEQPLDKVVLGASFGVVASPFYGKIALAGETVLNFDVYGFLGLGMVSKNNLRARYDDSGPPDDIVRLNEPVSEVKIGPYIGVGQNYFLSQSMAVKVDLRASFYVDNEPQYNLGEDVGQRLYNNVTASVGFAFFLPKMKPRFAEF